MRISIQLGETSNYSMELSDEGAIEIYADLLSHLLRKSVELKLPPPQAQVCEQPQLPVLPAVEVVAFTEELGNSVRVVEEFTFVKKTKETEVENPFAKHDAFRHKKLVAYKCPDCGKITVRFTVLGESNIVNCHFCRKDDIVIRTAKIASYRCAECNSKAYAWMCNGLKEIQCKDCLSPIDLFYDKIDDSLKSADLLHKNKNPKRRH